MKGAYKYVVRDITDILHPATIATLDNAGFPQFVSAAELSYFDSRKYSPQPLLRMPVTGSPTAVAANVCVGVYSFAWSPNGTTLAYVTVMGDNSGSQLHVVSGGIDRVANTMPMLPWGTGCESRECGDHLDARILYSPSGGYISFIENWGTPTVRVLKSDGTAITSIDSPGGRGDYKSKPTMSVWSGDSLYWRDAEGIQVWHDGAQSLLLPGVTWIRPKASPGGGQIVYETRDSSRVAHVHLFDTRSKTARELVASRSEPAFLNSHLIWYQEERACVANDLCQPGQLTTTSGKTYIYDLDDKSETESVIAAVFDVWPHAA